MSFLMSVLASSMAVASSMTGATCDGTAVHGRFESAAGGGTYQAVTFDAKAVPEGSRVTVLESTHRDGTEIELRVHGLQPDRTFGAHVHRKPCGTKPADSGAHYQDVVDPKQPSADPEYANPANEVWLDFTTDGRGNGSAESSVVFFFRAGEARSVVIHEHATETGPGHAGMAGARLACVNVPFD